MRPNSDPPVLGQSAAENQTGRSKSGESADGGVTDSGPGGAAGSDFAVVATVRRRAAAATAAMEPEPAARGSFIDAIFGRVAAGGEDDDEIDDSGSDDGIPKYRARPRRRHSQSQSQQQQQHRRRRRTATARLFCCCLNRAAALYQIAVAAGALALGLFIGAFVFGGVPHLNAAVRAPGPAAAAAEQLRIQQATIQILKEELARLKTHADPLAKTPPIDHRDGSNGHDADIRPPDERNNAHTEKALSPDGEGTVERDAARRSTHLDEELEHQRQGMLDRSDAAESGTVHNHDSKSPPDKGDHDHHEQAAATGDESHQSKSAVYFWSILPPSSVWCQGNSITDRICKFRNLCFHPKHDQWFILRTAGSVISNVPNDRTAEGNFIDLGSIANHRYFHWNYVDASPYSPSLMNVTMRYEETLHFITNRLHPRNIMHNIHDDTIGMYFLIKEFVGGGNERVHLPFSLKDHIVMIMDDYGPTDSTRPLEYLSDHPLRYRTYLKESGSDSHITCFRDAVVGSSKLTTWYQYGFHEPQGKIPNKNVNGLHIREVAEWIIHRMVQPLGHDENYSLDHRSLPPLDPSAANTAAVDFPETNIIVILSRRANRLILNEEELAGSLQAHFKLEVIFVRNEDYSFEEQIQFMRRARVVLAMHGSILIMSMFCRRGTIVIEMYPYAVPSENYTPYKSLAELTGMDLIYRAWENKHKNKSVAHPDNIELSGGIRHLPKEQQDAIENSETVPIHKCCTDPYWLYRIYQDTTVTAPEIIDLIEDGLHTSRKLLTSMHGHNWQQIRVPPSRIQTFKCLEHPDRPVGDLWASWSQSWNGDPVEQWNVYINNDQREYITANENPTIAIPGFAPNTTVVFFVRPMIGDWKGDWSVAGECVV